MSDLTAWLKRAGLDVESTGLSIVQSNQSKDDRNLIATRELTVGCVKQANNQTINQPLLNIPSTLLITPEKLRASPSIKQLVGASNQLNDSQILSLFLIYQRRLGSQSNFHAYIESLPASYSTLDWWSLEQIDKLGSRHRRLYSGLIDRIKFEWIQINRALHSGHPTLTPCQYDNDDDESTEESVDQSNNGPQIHPLPLRSSDLSHMPPHGHAKCCKSINQSVNISNANPMSAFPCLVSLAEYQWARAAVATRNCFWPSPDQSSNQPIKAKSGDRKSTSGKSSKSSDQSNNQSSNQSGSSCLIPFLDMLNHSHTVQSDCKFNTKTKCYELYVYPVASIKQSLTIPAGSQAFISYGSMNNAATLIRYGFVDDSNTAHSISVSAQEFEEFLTAHRKKGTHKTTTNQHIHHAPVDQPIESSDLPADARHCICGTETISSPLCHAEAADLRDRLLPTESLAPPSNFQLALMRNCGLYHCIGAYQIDSAIADAATVATSRQLTSELEAEFLSQAGVSGVGSSSSSRSQQSMAIQCCAVPWDLLTYVRIRCLVAAVKQPVQPAMELNIVMAGSNVTRRAVVVRTSDDTLKEEDMAPCSEALLNDQAMSQVHDRTSKQWLAAFLANRLAAITGEHSSLDASFKESQQHQDANDTVIAKYQLANQRLLLGCIHTLLQSEKHQ